MPLFGRKKGEEPVRVALARGGNPLTSLLVPFMLVSPCGYTTVQALRQRLGRAKTDAVVLRYATVAEGLPEGRVLVGFGSTAKLAEAFDSFSYRCSSGFPSRPFSEGLIEVRRVLERFSEAFLVMAYVPWPAMYRPNVKARCPDGFALPSHTALLKIVPPGVGEALTYKSEWEAAVAALDRAFAHVAYAATLVESAIPLFSEFSEFRPRVESGGDKGK